MKDIEKAAAMLQARRSVKNGHQQPEKNDNGLASTQLDVKSVGEVVNLSPDVTDNRPSLSSNATGEDRLNLTTAPENSGLADATAPSVLYGSNEKISANGISTNAVVDFRQLTIPLQKLEKLGHVTPNVAKNKLTEEYRRIKRPLIRNLSNTDIPSNSHVLMVTSAVSGEGKTFTSINLAMSLAQERERKILFIDADVLKGTAGDVLGASRSSPGLIDVLSGSVSAVHEVVHKTNVPNLWFVPAGQANSQANELLASEGMERCIRDMSQLFDECILVFDCPPILLTNEANVLLHHAGQIIFVVAEQQTSQKYVNSALAQVDDSKYLGLILNRSKNRHAVYSYGYS